MSRCYRSVDRLRACMVNDGPYGATLVLNRADVARATGYPEVALTVVNLDHDAGELLMNPKFFTDRPFSEFLVATLEGAEIVTRTWRTK